MLTLRELQAEHDIISMEAIANPFSAVNFKVKNSLQKIANHFSSLLSHKKEDAKLFPSEEHRVIYNNFSNEAKKIRTIGYIPFKDLLCAVPTGCNTNYKKLTMFLLDCNGKLENIDRNTIAPAHSVILKYLGKPELLNSITNADFKDVNLFTDVITSGKNELRTMFNYNLNNHNLKFNKLFNNVNELVDTYSLYRDKLTPLHLRHARERLKMVDAMKEFSKSIDLLMLRMEQQPEKYAINGVNAEKISSMILSVAEVLEFKGTVDVITEQSIACFHNMIFTFNNYINYNSDDAAIDFVKPKK